MGMHMGGPPGMRSFFRDSSVTKHKVVKGTGRRMMRFAAPYRRLLMVFLVLIVVDAVIGAVNPLIFRSIIDNGIIGKDSQLVVKLALLVAVLAIVDAGLSLAALGLGQRRRGADLRHAHPGLRAHPEDAASPSSPAPRPARWSVAAQQRRARRPAGLHRHLLVGGGQRDRRGHHPGGDVLPVVADHPGRRWCCCRSSCCRPAGSGGGCRRITRESYDAQRPDEQHDDRALQRRRARCWSSCSASPRDEVTGFFERRPGRVRDIGVTQAMYTRVFMAALLLTASLATALVYGWGGVLAVDGALHGRHGRGARPPTSPASTGRSPRCRTCRSTS